MKVTAKPVILACIKASIGCMYEGLTKQSDITSLSQKSLIIIALKTVMNKIASNLKIRCIRSNKNWQTRS